MTTLARPTSGTGATSASSPVGVGGLPAPTGPSPRGVRWSRWLRPGPRGSRTRRGRSRANLELRIGIAILALILLVGVAASIWPPHDPLTTGGTPFAAPDAEHWLGTDNLGRDTFTRILLAGRTGVFISAAATLAAALLGSPIGLAAGYFGGWGDAVVMRAVDGALAIPGILLALIVRVVLGAGTWQLILAMGLIYAPMMARVMRSPALVLRNREFVAAARVGGTSRLRILFTHILPNATSPLLIQSAAVASSAVALEAVLSYLGEGIQPPDPSAGRMIYEYQTYMQTDPMLVVAPAVVILALSFGWNLVADGLQTRLSLSGMDR